MGFLESFLHALGRSGLLSDASGTLLDDREGLKHYARSGFSAPRPGHGSLQRAQRLAEESPQK